MPKKKADELPKLPYGMGSYSWRNKDHSIIQYQKNIGEGEYKKRIVVYGHSVQECNAEMKKAEEEYKAECRRRTTMNPHNPALPLKIAVQQWMMQFKRPELKSKAYDTLEGTYERYLKPAEFANKQVEQVIDIDIQSWLADINSRLSDSTTKKCYSLINMYFNYYFARRPQDSPMLTVSLPKKDNKVRLDDEGIPIPPEDENKILDDDEIRRFEAEARKPYNPGKIGYRHGLVLVFMMWTFLRDGEAIALQWRDIDLDKKRAYIYKDYSYVKDRSDSDRHMKWELATTKTQSGLRYVYLCDKAMDALMEYRERMGSACAESDYIFVTEFGNPISNSYLNNLLERILERADIDKHISLHGLRHSGISYFRRHHFSPDLLSSMAGHSSRFFTDKEYYSVLDAQYQKEMEKINQTN